MKFCFTIVYVASVPNSLVFYKDAFGFETRFHDEFGQYCEMKTGETILAFASHTMAEMNLIQTDWQNQLNGFGG